MRRFTSILFGVEILAYALWIGGIVALAVAAPAIFRVVPSRHVAGAVFGEMLTRIFPLIYLCGAVLLLAGLARIGAHRRVARIDLVRLGLVTAMLGLALYVGTSVLGEMRALQASLPAPIETLPLESAERMRFDALHKLSERLMGLDVALGLLLLPFLIAGRAAPPPSAPPGERADAAPGSSHAARPENPGERSPRPAGSARTPTHAR